MTNISPRFPITAEEVDQLVDAFYARVREDAVLGPVFHRAVGTSDEAWQAHEEKISRFWRNAIGIQRGAYSGNPQLVHVGNSDILPEHFPRWLGLFRQTADEIMSPDKAVAIHALAERIGRGMSYGVEAARRPAGEPPRLL